MCATNQLAGFSANVTIDWRDVFRTAYPRHARKEVANAANVSLRRAKDLVEGVGRPTADEMFALSLHSPRIQKELWRHWMGAKRLDRQADRLAARSHHLDALDAGDGI